MICAVVVDLDVEGAAPGGAPLAIWVDGARAPGPLPRSGAPLRKSHAFAFAYEGLGRGSTTCSKKRRRQDGRRFAREGGQGRVWQQSGMGSPEWRGGVAQVRDGRGVEAPDTAWGGSRGQRVAGRRGDFGRVELGRWQDHAPCLAFAFHDRPRVWRMPVTTTFQVGWLPGLMVHLGRLRRAHVKVPCSHPRSSSPISFSVQLVVLFESLSHMLHLSPARTLVSALNSTLAVPSETGTRLSSRRSFSSPACTLYQPRRSRHGALPKRLHNYTFSQYVEVTSFEPLLPSVLDRLCARVLSRSQAPSGPIFFRPVCLTLR